MTSDRSDEDRTTTRDAGTPAPAPVRHPVLARLLEAAANGEAPEVADVLSAQSVRAPGG
jgi:hypothetical protein